MFRILFFIFIALFLVGCNSGSTTTKYVDVPSSTTTNTCVDNDLTSASCLVNSVGVMVTSVFGSNVSSWDNSLATTTVTGALPNGYYSGKSVTFNDSNLTANNIKSGVTLFGVSGALTSPPSPASNMLRDKTTTQITQDEESTTNAGLPYTNSDPGLRVIPRILKDDDGFLGGSVTKVSRTSWDNTCDSATGASGGTSDSPCKCGLSGTIEQRISDCSSHSVVGVNATWDGATKGNSGQGAWKLVTRTGALTSSKGREVWRDERTKMLWSSRIGNTVNWCRASGHNNVTNNPVAENDGNGFCNNASYQVVGIWSVGVNKAISGCYEDVDNDGVSDYFTTTHASIDNSGKAGLGASSTPSVAWRLPTKNDYVTASINGIGFVLEDNGSAEWTSTVVSYSRNSAWTISPQSTSISTSTRDSFIPFRCIGR